MKINGIYLMGCWLLVIGWRLSVIGCRLLVIGCWLSVAGLDCPVTRVTQWLAGAHETDILTDNQ